MKAKDLIPIPPLEEVKSVLCLTPHPDDAEIGAGGTLARLAQKGVTIYLAVVTDGRRGTFDANQPLETVAAIRQQEQEAAARHLGLKEVRWLGYPDGSTLPAEELRAKFIHLIRELKPQALLAPDPWLAYEAHPDHRATGLAAAEAAIFSGLPAFYPQAGLAPHQVELVAFYFTAHPNTFIDVTSTWEQKLAAIRLHRSQFPADNWPLVEGYLTLKASELAQQLVAPEENTPGGDAQTLAEGFKVLTPLHLHINVDAAIT